MIYSIINSIVGGGILININNFAKELGSLSPIIYIISYGLYLPIVYTLGKLVENKVINSKTLKINNEALNNKISETASFFISWGYLIGRILSFTVILHIITIGIRGSFSITTSHENYITIAVALTMSLMSIIIKEPNYKYITVFKIISLAIIVLVNISSFSMININISRDLPLFEQNLITNLPASLFALQGMSIVLFPNKIQKNPVRTMIITTCAAMIISSIFQFLTIGSIGDSITQTIPNFFQNIFIENNIIALLAQNLGYITLFAANFLILIGNITIFSKMFSSKISKIGTHAILLGITMTILNISRHINSLLASSVTSVFFSYLICCIIFSIDYKKQTCSNIVIGIIASACSILIMMLAIKNIANTNLIWALSALWTLGYLWNHQRPQNITLP